MAILGGTAHRKSGRRATQAIGLLLAGTAMFLQGAVAAPPAASEAQEYQVKAVFLFYFTQFVQWPPEAFADAKAPIVIGVIGDDPFGTDLEDAVHGEEVNGRPLAVRRFTRLDDVLGCHVLFVSRSESAQLERVLAAVSGRGILTVSDMDQFATRGGMIGFVTERSKVRLKINIDAAKSAGLRISSKLLRPAEIVSGRSN